MWWFSVTTTSLVALFCVMSMALFRPSCSHYPTNEFLDAHNAARAAVGVCPMVWNETLVAYATRYANRCSATCNLVHSNGPYGENLAAGSGDISDSDIVNLWVEEEKCYDYKTNSCVHGECKHYTQVVWRNSVRLGCAKVPCSGGLYTWFSICSYDPPGNWVGESPY